MQFNNEMKDKAHELHNVTLLNVFFYLYLRGSIYFENDKDIVYNVVEITSFSTQQVETLVKQDRLIYNYDIALKFQAASKLIIDELIVSPKSPAKQQK